MIAPIILPKTDTLEVKAEVKANEDLKKWLKEPVILWVALGEDIVTKEFVTKAEELINSKRSVYKVVRLIHALDPSLILEKLKSLRVNPELENPIDWNNLDKYYVLSISASTDTIGDIVVRSEFLAKPKKFYKGNLNRIMRNAIGVDA
ncbi:MAG: hypothetical protein ACI9Y7_002040 [Dokdonia sp.]|jgi:hypothetical protein